MLGFFKLQMQSYSRILKKSVDEEKNISLAEVDSVKIITDEEPDCESK